MLSEIEMSESIGEVNDVASYVIVPVMGSSVGGIESTSGMKFAAVNDTLIGMAHTELADISETAAINVVLRNQALICALPFDDIVWFASGAS